MTQEEHRSTSRVLDILELLASADEQGYTLTELADLVKAPKSSLFPIVHTLYRRRFLSQHPSTGRYTIGLGAFVVGSAFLDSQTLYDHIKKEMTWIVEKCGEICQMGVLDKGQVLYVAKVDSQESVRLISHVGKRLPLHCTALGKALVMNESTDALIRRFSQPGALPSLTSQSITEYPVLVKQLETFRKSGIAEENRESDEGIRCFAVPLVRDGRTVAALSVSVPAYRVTEERIPLFRDILTEAKGYIEQFLKDCNMELDFFSFLMQK